MTTLVRYPNPETATWTPFDRLSALRQEMERLWDWNMGARTAPVSSGWSPALDLFDTEDKLMAVVDLPGSSKDQIEISYQDGVLNISGERKSELPESKESGIYRSERCSGKFQRSLTLPFPIQSEKIRATYKNGVLSIELPKSEEAKPHKVAVSVG